MKKIPDPKIKAHVQNFLDQSNHHYSDSDSQASPRSNQKSRSAAQQLQQQQQQQRMNAANDPTLCRPSRIPTIIRSPVHAPKSSNTQQQQQQQQQKQSQLVTAAATTTPTTTSASTPTNGSASTNNSGTCFDEPAKRSGFEAYMMTGDLILNLSRTQQSTGLITSQSKKVRHSSHRLIIN